MFGASEVQMIGRYFGNTTAYCAAATTSRAVFHLASELEAASSAGVRAHQQHQAAQQRAEMDKLLRAQPQAQQKKHTAASNLSDDDLVQVLFASVDNSKKAKPSA